MVFPSVLGLAFALFILAITPGPGVFLTISRALNPGFRAAFMTILGIVLGDILYVLAAVMGLSAMQTMPPFLLLVIELLMSFYLTWYGVSAWLSAGQQARGVKNRTQFANWQYFSEGLLMTISNPKVVVFYAGFLPNFIVLTSIGWIELSIVLSTVVGVIGGVLVTYAFFAVQMQQYLQSERIHVWLNRVAASVILLAGLAIMLRVVSR